MRNFKSVLAALAIGGSLMMVPVSASASPLAIGAGVQKAEMTTGVELAGHKGQKKWRRHGHHGKWRHRGKHRHYAFRHHRRHHHHHRRHRHHWPYGGYYAGCGYPYYGFYDYPFSPYCGGYYGGPFITFGFGF